MGNRASITAHPITEDSIGIYVHWNGGQESVAAFCAAAKELGVRDLVNDEDYGLARLAQIIGNFFGGTTSIGVGRVMNQDFSDNGIWAVNKNWELVQDKHKYAANIRKLDVEMEHKSNEIKKHIVMMEKAYETLRNEGD